MRSDVEQLLLLFGSSVSQRVVCSALLSDCMLSVIFSSKIHEIPSKISAAGNHVVSQRRDGMMLPHAQKDTKRGLVKTDGFH